MKTSAKHFGLGVGP